MGHSLSEKVTHLLVTFHSLFGRFFCFGKACISICSVVVGGGRGFLPMTFLDNMGKIDSKILFYIEKKKKCT